MTKGRVAHYFLAHNTSFRGAVRWSLCSRQANCLLPLYQLHIALAHSSRQGSKLARYSFKTVGDWNLNTTQKLIQFCLVEMLPSVNLSESDHQLSVFVCFKCLFFFGFFEHLKQKWTDFCDWFSHLLYHLITFLCKSSVYHYFSMTY